MALSVWSPPLAAAVIAGWGLTRPAGAVAQALESTLRAPDGVASRAFERITGVHELPDGRVVVVDATVQAVLLADFARRVVVQLGRIGSGPGEYRFPHRLFRLGGDSIGIEDLGNQRILVITAAGRWGVILSSRGTGTPGRGPERGTPPRASDGQGRLYALGYSPFTPEASQPADSAPIERWTIGAAVRDTVAYLPLPPRNERTLQPGQGSRAFATRAQWAVDPQGRIAIVRGAPYAVDLIGASGARILGRPIPYRQLAVTDDHKRQWREEQAQPRPVTIAPPDGSAPTLGLRRFTPTEPVQWPSVMPPFLDDAVRFAPNGVLWVQRTVAVGSPALFDLVDPNGKVVERMAAPAGTRLIGFGRSHVYLVRKNEDGEEFLERYFRAPPNGP